MEALFGLILVAIVAVVTWCVASEGAWGAGLTFLCVLFSGLLAMNFFEPIAAYLEKSADWLRPYSDVVSLVGLFALLVFLGRSLTDSLSPTSIELDGRAWQAARWFFAAATGYTTMAFLLTALHTAPLPREFIGFAPERRNLFDVRAPDREWLGFTQYVSERVLRTGRYFDGPESQDPPEVWPSFPIRYATRRDMYGGGSRSAADGGPSGLGKSLKGSGGGTKRGGGTKTAF